jgi:hypothetical protein
MSRKTAAEQRKENLDRLKELAEAANAPGKDQAKQALDSIQQQESPVGPRSTDVPPESPDENQPVVSTPTSKVEAPKRASQPTEILSAAKNKAEKISISLHPQDQDRLSKIENALRSKGLIGRSASTSFLLKVALASFDETKVRDLKSISDSIHAQDQRGKWMK